MRNTTLMEIRLLRMRESPPSAPAGTTTVRRDRRASSNEAAAEAHFTQRLMLRELQENEEVLARRLVELQDS